MSKINISLPADLWQAFRVACVIRKTAASKVIAELIDAQLTRWKQEAETAAQPDASPPYSASGSLAHERIPS
jgi:hypothetical protein